MFSILQDFFLDFGFAGSGDHHVSQDCFSWRAERHARVKANGETFPTVHSF